MIQITPQMRVLVCIEPVDFRSGIDRLSCICRLALGASRQRNCLCFLQSVKSADYGADAFRLTGERLRQDPAGARRHQ